MTKKKPQPNPQLPARQINNFDDILFLLQDVLNSLTSGGMDSRTSNAVMNITKQITATIEAREKLDPNKAALRAFSAETAQRAARSFSPEEAKMILMQRNFVALEDKARIIEAEKVQEEAPPPVPEETVFKRKTRRQIGAEIRQRVAEEKKARLEKKLAKKVNNDAEAKEVQS